MNENAKATSFDLYVKAPSGTEAALHVELADVAHLQEIVEGMKRADALLKAAGFQRSERLDKPAYQKGGGFQQQRQIVPPPDDVEIPTELHCGVPWEYKPEKPGSDDRPGYPAHWECGKGRACEKPRTNNGRNYPAELRITKKKQAPKESTPPAPPVPAAQGSAAPAPRQPAGAQTISRFWETAKALGFSTKDVLAIAKAPGIQGFTAEELHSLHDHMKAIQRGQAVGDWSRAA